MSNEILSSSKCRLNVNSGGGGGGGECGLIPEVWIVRADNKSFFIFFFIFLIFLGPDSAAFSSRHSRLYMLSFNTAAAEEEELEEEAESSSSSSVAPLTLNQTARQAFQCRYRHPAGGDLEKTSPVASSLPCPAASWRCLGFGRRSTGAPRR